MTTDPEKRLRRITNAPTKGGEIVRLTGFATTEIGNAERFAKDHSRDVRYCAEQDQWFVWDERRWAEDTSLKIQALAKETIRGIGKEAAEYDDDDKRKEHLKWALKSERAAAVQAMISLARSEPGIPVLMADFDKSPWLLNVENGTLDLKTGTLRPHDRSDMITKLAPVKYDPDATCPLWIYFLERIFGSDADLIQFVQRVLGYCLTGDTSEQAFFIGYGGGQNGKSTLIEAIVSMLGEGYATQSPMNAFLSQNNSNSGAASPDLARLRGARFVTAVEAESGRKLNEAMLKEITGEDKISARPLYKNPISFKPYFKIFMATNHKPVIRNNDHAIWRRIKLIPFNVQIPPEERDRGLRAKLKAELPGILNWVLRGCLDWQRQGLGESEAVKMATANYREESDQLADFFATCCVMDPSAKTPAKAAYEAYRRLCESEGSEPMSNKRFGELLGQRDGIKKDRNKHGVIYEGLAIVRTV